MRWSLWTLSVLLLNTLATVHTPAEETVADPEAEERIVAGLVERLASDEFDTRQSASAEIEKLGGWAYPLLKKLRNVSKDLEVQTRLDKALEKLAPLAIQVGEPLIFALTYGKNSSGSTVLLDGTPSCSRAGGDGSYQWRQIEGPDLQIPESDMRRTCVMVRVKTAGTYKFELVVKNGCRATLPGIVEVIVADTREELEVLKRKRQADDAKK
jgi:hypothetical protein